METKRKRGRPVGTHNPPVYVERLQIMLKDGGLDALDQDAAEADMKRSDYVRLLIAQGLDS